VNGGDVPSFWKSKIDFIIKLKGSPALTFRATRIPNFLQISINLVNQSDYKEALTDLKGRRLGSSHARISPFMIQDP
jgi:hypothetical protein